MCDTIVATPQVTTHGEMLFGKNSDREPNEAQYLEKIDSADYAPGERLQCTYIEIPQAPHTNAVILSRPFWMWGAEMGVNDHNVVIGNEAVFTKMPFEKQSGLTGMDLLRLGLERGNSALETLRIMTDLLEQFGQGGNCGYSHAFFYHNSFLIADAAEAWVLETAGKEWAARRVTGSASISNGLTIRREFDLSSRGLITNAVKRGWCTSENEFNFADSYEDRFYRWAGACQPRQKRTSERLNAGHGTLTERDMIAILRDHKRGENKDVLPSQGVHGMSVCAHAGFGPFRDSQSVGSLVVKLMVGQPAEIYYTATSAPCTGIFKPAWMDCVLPDFGPAPTGKYDDRCLWWRHERLHRAVLEDFENRLGAFSAQREAFENRVFEMTEKARQAEPDERTALSVQIAVEAEKLEEEWLDRVLTLPVGNAIGGFYARTWRKHNRTAEMPAPELPFRR